MNLYIFPILPSKKNGYGIAVASDYERLKPRVEDVVIWYSTSDNPSYHQIMIRPRKFAISRVINVIQNKVNSEVTESDLRKMDFKPSEIDSIFCGDVIFYRALRSIFPEKQINVRFHNCFGRILDRVRLIDEPVNLRFKIQSRAFYKLEKEIFHDSNVHKIFISEEDRNYYTSNFGVESDSEVWGFMPDMNKATVLRSNTRKNKIVHLGGVQSHKIDGIKWFINDVFYPLRKSYPLLEFHLYGKGTDLFNNPDNGIFGHGFYNGEHFPLVNEGLYINPDVIGGGVKIKLLKYFEEGTTFITTPFGYEGYPKDLIDNKYCYVIEKEKWYSFMNKYFSNNKL